MPRSGTATSTPAGGRQRDQAVYSATDTKTLRREVPHKDPIAQGQDPNFTATSATIRRMQPTDGQPPDRQGAGPRAVTQCSARWASATSALISCPRTLPGRPVHPVLHLPGQAAGVKQAILASTAGLRAESRRCSGDYAGKHLAMDANAPSSGSRRHRAASGHQPRMPAMPAGILTRASAIQPWSGLVG